MFELETAVLFLILTVAGYELPDAVANNVNPYARAIAVVGFVLLAISSLPFRPFTEEYMREVVPSVQLKSRTFVRTNRMLTAMWGLIALVVSLSFVVGTWVSSAPLPTILNWIVPFLLVLIGLRYSASRFQDELDETSIVSIGLDGAFDVPIDGTRNLIPHRKGSPSLRLLRRPE